MTSQQKLSADQQTISRPHQNKRIQFPVQQVGDGGVPSRSGLDSAGLDRRCEAAQTVARWIYCRGDSSVFLGGTMRSSVFPSMRLMADDVLTLTKAD